MPFIPVPDTVYVSIGMELADKVASFGFGVRKDTPWSLSHMATLAASVETWCNSAPVIRFATTFALINVRVTDLSSSSGPVVEVPIVPVTRGTGGGDQMPNNVAVVCTLRTLNRGRSYRGRVYLAGFVEGAIQDNAIVTVAAGDLNTWMDSLIPAIAPSDASLAVISRYENNAPRAVGIATDVVGIDVNTRVDTQRRRLPR